MLVNASFDPGDFYVETVSGLCANTTYEFAAWVMNVVRTPNQIKPNITFSIEKKDGTVLGVFQSGDIDISGVPQWKKYGFNFKTPPGAFEVILRMRNNAPGGIGNDVAIDDITFRACGPALVNEMDGSVDTVHLCEGDVQSFQLKASVPPFFTNPAFQWQESTDGGASWHDLTGANTIEAIVRPSAVGRYWYRFSAAEAENFSSTGCRVVSNVTAVVIHANPMVNAGPDKVVIKGETIVLQGRLQGESGTYSWSPAVFMNSPTTLTPSISPLEDIKYTLLATSTYGCSNSDDVFVKVINGIYIPTSFTPNGDGLNDTWRVPFIEYATEADVKIFNRNGNLVYQMKGGVAEWNGTIKGKPQPNGVYIYLVTLKKGGQPLKGFITLMR
jgi:gliding motility-associated-like protein